MISSLLFDRCDKKTVFFVHIPKTGGTSLFRWLSDIFGPEQCCEHIESILLPRPAENAVDFLERYAVVSGHIPIDYKMYLSGSVVPITVLRDPLAQFFSHVNHIKTVQVETGDLKSIKEKLMVSVEYFLENASDTEIEFFENPQSKTVFGGLADWRIMSLSERMSWLGQTYAAVLTTETMNDELSSVEVERCAENGSLVFTQAGPMNLEGNPSNKSESLSTNRQIPFLNTRDYDIDRLTHETLGRLNTIIGHDLMLHRAVGQHHLKQL